MRGPNNLVAAAIAAASFADIVTTDTSTTITSATAGFSTARDVGKVIAGAGIPGGTTIASVTNATTAELSAAATATASGVTATIARTVRTASSNSGAYVGDLGNGGSKLALAVLVSAAIGTTPTLDLTVEWSPDNGTNWFVVDTADSFAQITAAKKVVKLFDVKAPDYRVVWTIGGTLPGFTFTVDELIPV